MDVAHLRRFAGVIIALAVLCVGEAHAQRPTPPELPEARADTVVADAGNATRIEVLANDLGMPAAGQPNPEIRLEGTPSCGTVQIDGRALIFTGGASCIGPEIVFGYSVKVNGEWWTAPISVTVRAAAPIARPPPGVARATTPCTVPDSDWQLVRIEGGPFNKSAVPAGIVDFADLIDEPTFSVDSFCITIDAVPAEPVDRYFNNLNEDERTNQFPELASQTTTPAGQTGRTLANASQAMAIAFSKRFGERSGRALTLPTLQEYVAAAWELQSKYPGTPQADAFLILVRSGNLQWTSTPCGNPGSFWAIGPSTGAQAKLVKLCYNASRIDRTGFRLVVKQ